MKKWVSLVLIVCLLSTGCKGKVEEKPEVPDTESAVSEEAEVVTEEEAIIEEEEVEEEDKVTGTLEEIATALFEAYEAKDYDKMLKNFKYDSATGAQISEAILVEAWNTIVMPYGEFDQITEHKRETQVEYEIVNMFCQFSKGSIVFNVVFNDEKEIAGFNIVPHAQEGVKPDNVEEIEVSFGSAQMQLPATLTLPKDQTNCPVVILVHGSGPNDRNETIGMNQPFKDIAWQLASMGIGVLRYDKRTYVYPSEMAADPNITVYQETIEDVKYAYTFLENYEGIDSDNIFVLGHSLGGYLMPRIAMEVPEAKGYILLAGSARPLEDLMLEQITYISNLDNDISDDDQNAIDYYTNFKETVKNLDPSVEYSLEQLMGVPKEYWLDLKAYDPINVMQGVEKPILILQGSRDYQVTLTDYQLWQDGLSTKSNVTFELFEGLNHLFIEGTGNSTPEEYNVPGSVSSGVTAEIVQWMGNQ